MNTSGGVWRGSHRGWLLSRLIQSLCTKYSVRLLMRPRFSQGDRLTISLLRLG